MNVRTKINHTLGFYLESRSDWGLSIVLIGFASLLTYLDLGALIPWWRWIGFGFIVLGAAGFILDYRDHRKLLPLVLLTVGAVLLYIGRHLNKNGKLSIIEI